MLSLHTALIVAQRYHLETEYRTSLSAYIRMNSHICHWSPFSKVAIIWRRKGIDRQPEAKKKWTRTPGLPVMPCCAAGTRGFWEKRSMSVVRLYNKWRCISSSANVVELDSLVRLAIRWDQSPRNWHLRPSNFCTNPQGWSIRWCHGDVTVSIMCNVPLRKRIIS